MSVFEKLFGPKKGTAQYYLNKGSEELLNFKFKDAVDQFTKAIDLDPVRSEGYYYRGLAYRMQPQFELAINDFKQALKLNARDKASEFWLSNTENAVRYDELIDKHAIALEKGTAVPTAEMAYYIEHIIDWLETIDRYRSVLIVRDLKCGELRDVDFEIIKWGMVHVKPNSFSIDQCTNLENFPHGSCDIWNSLEGEEYQTLFVFSIQSKRTSSEEIYSFLNIEKYRQFLQPEMIDRIRMSFSRDGERIRLETEMTPDVSLGSWTSINLRKKLARSLYHMIGQRTGKGLQLFELPTVGKGGMLEPKSIASTPDVSMVEDNFKAILTIWVDSSNYSLEKAQIRLSGDLTNGEEVLLVIEQVFDDFNGNIRVLAPPMR